MKIFRAQARGSHLVRCAFAFSLLPVIAPAQSVGYISSSSAFAAFNYKNGLVGPLLSFSNPYPGQFAVSADGSTLYVPSGTARSGSNQINVVSGSTGIVLRTITGVHQQVTKLLLSRDEATLFALTTGGAIYKVDIASGVATARVSLMNTVEDCALSPDGTTLYVTRFSGGVVALNTLDLSQKWNLEHLLSGLLTISEDGKSLYVSGGVTGPHYGFLIEINTATQTVRKIVTTSNTVEEYLVVPPTGHVGVVFSIGFSPISPYGFQSFSANFINTKTNRLDGLFLPVISSGYVPAFQPYGDYFVPIAFAPNGQSIWMLTTCVDPSLCVPNTWQLEGFTFPGGAAIGLTPLPDALGVLGMPRRP